jgi:hypothetical protein
MSELIIFSIPFLIGMAFGILIGMGLQVRSEKRWIKKTESGRSANTQRRSTPQIVSDGSPPPVRNGSPKTDRPAGVLP